ncbi:hypothetical protein KDW_42930 [Dictyobacter vulcani]|uniref:Carrier domain-containing protein n=1 Tax=Dictyobacter vulcani TaxID=2607529 RepID=A0A5J4KUF3_9CHLR|nr:non-ribosomal peptide synthetase [Dictyobacter vulcani]GER90131.1 hypothetical protein KDW_42930 [Dictyobacter vulcani]
MLEEEAQTHIFQSRWGRYHNSPNQHTLAQMIEAQVDRTPDGLALVAPEGTLNYRDMDQQANQIAHMLHALGQTPRQPVGLCVPPSLIASLGLLGILKAGCIYVPLDSRLPRERLAWLATQANIQLIVTVAALEETVTSTGLQVLCLDQQWEQIQQQPITRPVSTLIADDVAYIFYTSGSTGMPKGVMISHRAILNRLWWGIEDCDLQAGDRLAQVASWSFDIAVWEICAPWLVGASTVIFPVERVLDPRQFIAALQSEQITVIHVVPSLLSLLVQEPTLAQCTSLRCVMSGGEAVSAQLLQRFARILPIAVQQLYGPTEAAISMTSSLIQPGEQRTFIPLGDPITNTYVYLLDQQQQQVPTGVQGELYIGGECLAWGYKNRPDLTAERFLPDPFSDQPGRRIYRTGDIVRRYANGELEYIGRSDDQVKIRGHRIEPGEIEAHLQSHPAVQQGVVKVFRNQRDEQQLAAYVVAAPGESLSTIALRHYLQQRLPEYMLPATFIHLEHLPLNHNGKIDRAALPVPSSADLRSTNPYVAPQTQVQERVATIWSDVLQTQPIGINDDFFAIGGHSLLTIRVLTRIREAFQIDLPLQTLFEYPTIATLAARIDQTPVASQTTEIVALPVGDQTHLPLSFAQERLWFLDQLAEGSDFYTIPLAVRLRRILNLPLFYQSFQAIIERHEILRTSFQALNGQPRQVIAPMLNLPLPLIDIRHLKDPEKAFQQCCLELIQLPFQLTQPPLLRAVLFQQANDDFVLALAIHHIVADGWSMAIFIHELLNTYEALLAGQTPVLPALTLQYKDFALWERGYLNEAYLESHLAYWQQELADAPALLELPYDHPRPPVLSYRGAQHFFKLPSLLRTQLQQVSRQENVTLYMTLLAAFQVLLARYSGQDDIVLGTPVAGRNHSSVEQLIGFFANTLAIRIHLGGQPSFKEVLQRTKKTMQLAYTHQEAPFERVVEIVQPERSLSYHSLFQTSFAWENVLFSENSSTQRDIEQVHFDTGMAKFDLTLYLWEEDAQLAGYFEYNTDLFEAETMARWASNFHTLLEACVATPDRNIHQLSLLSRKEQYDLISTYNPPATPASTILCIHEYFERQAQRVPTNIALTQADTDITYQQLEQQANQLAHYLHSLNVTTGTSVAICLERTPWMVVAMLAILKVGGVYVPLDPSTPPERVAFIIQDAHCALVITQQTLVNHLVHIQAEAQLLCLEHSQEILSTYPTHRIAVPSSPEQLAYSIYTSGSTGRPKGVGITHRNLHNMVQWHQQAFALSSHERSTHLAGLGFDASVWELWPYVLMGSRIFLVADDVRMDALKLQQFLIQQQITICFAPTPLAEQLLILEWPKTCALRLLLVGGDVLHSFSTAGLPFQVINNYGPTECTIVATSGQVSTTTAGQLPDIGYPISGVQLYILDEFLQLTPQGAIGELCIGGASVGYGYINQPAMTAERFIPDPFGSSEGSRLYRTGDLVRYRTDHSLEFIGRRDQQVKIRGFRIEIGEIEALLQHHPDVAECVVLLQAEQPAIQRLVAYLVPVSDTTLSENQLQSYLQERLPAYMLPASYLFLPALPLTPNGKIDRKRLPHPDYGLSSPSQLTGPRTPTEETLAHIWMDVLQLEHVGIYDNFFALGGHSLLATRLIARTNKAFNVNVPLRVLFSMPTIAEIAEVITASQSGSPQASLATEHKIVAHQPEQTDFPLSLAQERLWFLYQLDTNSALYNVALHFQIQGDLQVRALQRSLKDLVQRHEALRTTLHITDGQPRVSWQHINDSAEEQFPLVDVSSLPPVVRQREQQRLRRQDAEAPFDLSNGPLLRCTLLKIQDQAHIFLFTIHHMATDGWSMGVLLDDLHAFYNAYSQGTAPTLPERTFQYADYAVWQRQWLQHEQFQQQLQYWKQHLDGAPNLLELPTDYPRPALLSYRGDAYQFGLSAELSARLRATSQQQGVTLFVTLVSAYLILLSRYTGQTDLVLGLPVAGRTQIELEEIVGFFVNTLPLRYKVSGSLSCSELLQHVQQVALDAYAHQDVPFDRIVEALQPERNSSYQPIIQATCVIEQEPVQVQLGDLLVGKLPSHTATSKFDLSLTWEDTSSSLQATFEYATDLFAPHSIKQFARTLETILEQMVEHPQRPLARLALLSPQEEDKLLYQLNETQQRSIPGPTEVAALFEEQVTRDPDALAIVSETDEVLSYAALNQRANQLAHYLQAQGIGPEICVGLCAERSLNLIIGILAVLKAGEVYVPIDPKLPPARLNFLLKDASIQLLLVQQQFLEKVAEWSGPVHCLDRDESNLLQYASTNPQRETCGQNLAYVLYTSGSTGQPKGVAVTHQGIIRLVRETDYIQIKTADVMLHLSNVSFDAATFEIWGALLNGAKLVVMPRELMLVPKNFYQRLSEHRATIMLATTMFFNQLAYLHPDIYEHMRVVLFGGERADPHAIQSMFEHKPEHLINVYGPTENATFSTVYHIETLSDPARNIPIGPPITNTTVYVLDNNMQPVPPGCVGELYLGGAGLARGYVQRADITAASFLPHPFSQKPGARLYKSGDLVRWLEHGELDFVGRTDEQVKIRGFRIELQEIEAVLQQHPGVQKSLVITHKDPGGNIRLVAYIVPQTQNSLSTQTVHEWMQARLPDYMLPLLILVPAFVANKNGKIDRTQLPLPEWGQSEQTEREPETVIEQQLAIIWQELLHIQHVSAQANFFASGGHSLLLMQMVSRIRTTFQVDIPIRVLFEYATLAELAREIEQKMQQEQTDIAPQVAEIPIQPRETDDTQDLLALLEGLSPEELEQFLSEEDSEIEE